MQKKTHKKLNSYKFSRVEFRHLSNQLAKIKREKNLWIF